MGSKKKKRREAQRRAAEGGKKAEAAQPEPAESWLQAKGPALRFVLIAGTFMVLFYTFFYTPPEESPRLNEFIESYLRAYASAAGALLGLVGFETSVQGSTIFLDGHVVKVVRGCDAMEPIALFIAAVIAFPLGLRAKLIGLAAGIPALVFINLGRITALTVVDGLWPQHFETAHLTVGQTLYVLATLCCWFVWVSWASKAEKKGDAPAAA